MTIKQLSVFLENKTGRINDVARILGEHGINMYAFSMAETADFGILRMIVSDVEAAKRVLREAKFAVTAHRRGGNQLPQHAGLALSGAGYSGPRAGLHRIYVRLFRRGTGQRDHPSYGRGQMYRNAQPVQMSFGFVPFRINGQRLQYIEKRQKADEKSSAFCYSALPAIDPVRFGVKRSCSDRKDSPAAFNSIRKNFLYING